MGGWTRRAVVAAGGAAAVAGCAAPDPAARGPVGMGDFQLVAPIVVTRGLRQIPPSRPAAPEAWEAAVKDALRARFGGYRGGRDYYIALALDGYALAPPGIPVVLAPKSVLVATANVWTAEPQEKVLGPHQLTTFEGPEGLILGTGLIKDAAAQMATLAANMAAAVQAWMLRRPEQFGLPGRG